jgi:hypothetical protein
MKNLLIPFVIVCAKIGYAQDSTLLSIEESVTAAMQTKEHTSNTVNPKLVSEKSGYTTEPLMGQRFDRAKWEEVVGSKDYSESETESKQKKELAESGNSKFSRGKQRIERKERNDNQFESKSISVNPSISFILNIIVYALAIGIIGYILFVIFKNVSLKSKGKIITKDTVNDPSTYIADIKELEIDRLLGEAKATGDYRLVIRLYFLGLLRKLDETGHIAWKRDKTNRDYLSELFPKKYFFDEVKTLTRVYEEVWYGDHVYQINAYEEIISSFKIVERKINNSKA